MPPRFNSLVRKETCAIIAEGLDLGQVLRLWRSEMLSGGRTKITLLGDAMEAVLAAIYLDSNLSNLYQVDCCHSYICYFLY